jgi:hypothetical protein
MRELPARGGPDLRHLAHRRQAIETGQQRGLQGGRDRQGRHRPDRCVAVADVGQQAALDHSLGRSSISVWARRDFERGVGDGGRALGIAVEDSDPQSGSGWIQCQATPGAWRRRDTIAMFFSDNGPYGETAREFGNLGPPIWATAVHFAGNSVRRQGRDPHLRLYALARDM